MTPRSSIRWSLRVRNSASASERRSGTRCTASRRTACEDIEPRRPTAASHRRTRERHQPLQRRIHRVQFLGRAHRSEGRPAAPVPRLDQQLTRGAARKDRHPAPSAGRRRDGAGDGQVSPRPSRPPSGPRASSSTRSPPVAHAERGQSTGIGASTRPIRAVGTPSERIAVHRSPSRSRRSNSPCAPRRKTEKRCPRHAAAGEKTSSAIATQCCRFRPSSCEVIR
jgi:hypothetical protein